MRLFERRLRRTLTAGEHATLRQRLDTVGAARTRRRGAGPGGRDPGDVAHGPRRAVADAFERARVAGQAYAPHRGCSHPLPSLQSPRATKTEIVVQACRDVPKTEGRADEDGVGVVPAANAEHTVGATACGRKWDAWIAHWTHP